MALVITADFSHRETNGLGVLTLNITRNGASWNTGLITISPVAVSGILASISSVGGRSPQSNLTGTGNCIIDGSLSHPVIVSQDASGGLNLDVLNGPSATSSVIIQATIVYPTI